MSPTPACRVSLDAAELEFMRDGVRIFGPLSFALVGGDLLAIGGPNGAGKTSLLNVLAGLLIQSAGSLRFNSQDMPSDAIPSSNRATGVALLGHLNGLKLDLSPRANLRFRDALCAGTNGDSIDDDLADVGLAGLEDVPMRGLSAGQRRRVAIAALVRNPAMLWLLDEPFANLDADGRTLVAGAIARQRQRGGIVVMSTHGADALPADARHLALAAV